jgi:hypothetical protein
MRALIPLAVLALWGCATGQDQLSADMAACDAAYKAVVPSPMPSNEELAAKGPEYASAFIDRVRAAGRQLDNCHQRAFLDAERQDAATAAGLGALSGCRGQPARHGREHAESAGARSLSSASATARDCAAGSRANHEYNAQAVASALVQTRLSVQQHDSVSAAVAVHSRGLALNSSAVAGKRARARVVVSEY